MKSLTTISRLVHLVLLLTAIPAFSVPLPRTEKTTIQGTVVDWTWRSEIDFQQEFQGRAYGQMIPGHYIIRLKIQKKRNDLFNTINGYSRLLRIGIGIDADDLKEDELIVYLPTSRLKGLLKGAKLTIEDYSISADDSGAEASSSKILIDDATPETLGPIFPPNK